MSNVKVDAKEEMEKVDVSNNEEIVNTIMSVSKQIIFIFVIITIAYFVCVGVAVETAPEVIPWYDFWSTPDPKWWMFWK